MFGYGREVSHHPGSRRLGGPIEFKDLWPVLREELHEAHLARGGLGHRDPEPTRDELGDASEAFSTAA